MKFKGIFLVLVLILIVAVVGFLFSIINANNTREKNTLRNKESKVSTDNLIVFPQAPKDKVVADSVTLSKNGFLVLRQIEDGKLSQIVEMSEPLAAGTHKNIPISFGTADVGNSELIIMIYEDYANDEIFNDLDMPALDENGNMIARYVATGKPIPSTLAEGDTSDGMMNMPGMKSMVKVSLTDEGFDPEKVEIEVGDMVEFINESNSDMWVASNPHPAHTKLPTFDEFRTVKTGGRYRYTFDKKGTWEYHNHVGEVGGIVIVN